MQDLRFREVGLRIKIIADVRRVKNLGSGKNILGLGILGGT